MFTNNERRSDEVENIDIFPLVSTLFFMVGAAIIALVFRKKIRACLVAMQERQNQQQHHGIFNPNDTIQSHNMHPPFLTATTTTAQHGNDQPLTILRHTTPTTLGNNQQQQPCHQQPHLQSMDNSFSPTLYRPF